MFIVKFLNDEIIKVKDLNEISKPKQVKSVKWDSPEKYLIPNNIIFRRFSNIESIFGGYILPRDSSCLFSNLKFLKMLSPDIDSSNTTGMGRMFYNCSNFSGDLKGWNTNRLMDNTAMFHGCKNFSDDHEHIQNNYPK